MDKNMESQMYFESGGYAGAPRKSPINENRALRVSLLQLCKDSVHKYW